MKLSFIVITYHRGELLQNCIDSILNQKGLPYSYEIIVIDNGGDAEVHVAENLAIHLRLERTGRNLGAAGGRNRGMELAQGDYWVSIDDDAIWHREDDVARIVAHLDHRPEVGAVAVQSLTPDGRVIQVELPHPNKAYINHVSQPVEVPYFYTMGLALRADVVRRVGDYPARFQIYMEELDLSLRLVDAGYRIIYDPSVAVYHHKSNLGRPIAGDNYWKMNALNKMRVAWRLLPLPYPITICAIWSLAILVKTHSINTLVTVWRTLWNERSLLEQERRPIRAETIKYLKSIGARLSY